MKTLALILKTIFLSCSLTLFAHCGTTDPYTPDSDYINYAKEFKFVYRVCGTYNDGGLYCASCVAINKHWFVTAAHVVENSKMCVVHRGDVDEAFIVKKIICHDNFDTKKFGIGDIALLQVEEDIGLDFYPGLYDKDDEKDKLCSIAGYGMYGTFLTGLKHSDDNMRAGSNYIDETEKDLLICSPTAGKSKTKLEFIICSGDSGGGLFIGNDLAGINSCVVTSDDKPDSSYGDIGCHTRISKYVEWIKQTIKDNTKKDTPF